MKKVEWILCLVCGSKTRDKIWEDTVLRNYPLYCPRYSQETINFRSCGRHDIEKFFDI